MYGGTQESRSWIFRKCLPYVIKMFYTYVLISLKDKKFYTGYTADIENRLLIHNNGEVASTKNRRPLRLIYYEACINQEDALHREKYLKSTYGKRFIKSRLKHYLKIEGYYIG